MFFRKELGVAIAIALAAAGCAQQPKLTAEELGKLKGGRTTVVAYFVCAPINYVTGAKLATYTANILVDGKVVSKIEDCGHTRFTVDSGQRELAVANPNNLFSPNGHPRTEIFRPGATQYLSVHQDGQTVLSHRWRTKSEAEEGIAALNKIKPVF